MFWNLFWPIALITLANCFYNICTKSTPEQANPFLSLCVTYLTAAAVCISVFIFSQSREAVSLELSKLNWTAPTLGLAVVALEVGYILTYRAGWKINTASLVTNIALAILLLFIGFLFYGSTTSEPDNNSRRNDGRWEVDDRQSAGCVDGDEFRRS